MSTSDKTRAGRKKEAALAKAVQGTFHSHSGKSHSIHMEADHAYQQLVIGTDFSEKMQPPHETLS